VTAAAAAAAAVAAVVRLLLAGSILPASADVVTAAGSGTTPERTAPEASIAGGTGSVALHRP